MITMKNLTFRIAGRTLFQDANMFVAAGQKAALIGRNGAGKSTLFKLLRGEIAPDDGSIELPRDVRIGSMAQEIPASDQTILDYVLSADQEREELMIELELTEDPIRVSDIHTRLGEIDAYAAPAKASKILIGLGFKDEELKRPVSAFSGGWRVRMALAAALFSEPDILLLDEPTNHLDFEATVWLEKFLKNYPRTILLISHDRHVLNAVPDKIIHLSQQDLKAYSGNYDFFEKTRKEQMLIQQAAQKKQEAARAHMQKFVDRFRAQATKAKQVQSRIKMMERFEPITMLRDEPSLRLNFPDPGTLPPPMITIDAGVAGYGDKVVLRGLNQRLDLEDRIALLGQNGNGKSTLAKVLAGKLELLKGSTDFAEHLRIGYFHQHQIEDLHKDRTPYQHMAEVMEKALPEQVRTRLGGFGFSRDKADVEVGKLSGGEKARLTFALMTYHKPHLIILDEPTNHLDVESRDSLIMAINEFKGAVILISHDWHLLEHTIDKLWVVGDGKVQPFDDSLEDYCRALAGGGEKKSGARADEIKAKKQAKKSKQKKNQPVKKKSKSKKQPEGFFME
ncbi:MAG: ABC-F family ATP-binding cassette domain-containing protein [Alphaproteobacteria bacterium]